MKFPKPLIEGIFLKRYKRFFADVRLGNRTVVAHVPNTGSLESCKIPESPCLVSFHDEPKRKLQYTLEMVRTPTSWVGVNTATPNKLVWEAWEKRLISHWSEFKQGRREVKLNEATRLDMALWQDSDEFPHWKDLPKSQRRFHFIEVKNVTLRRETTAYFPDAVTERGQKHLEEMVELIKAGHTCELVFVIQREDCQDFAPAEDIDPDYARKLRQAVKQGLQVTPLVCRLNSEKIELGTKIKQRF